MADLLPEPCFLGAQGFFYHSVGNTYLLNYLNIFSIATKAGVSELCWISPLIRYYLLYTLQRITNVCICLSELFPFLIMTLFWNFLFLFQWNLWREMSELIGLILKLTVKINYFWYVRVLFYLLRIVILYSLSLLYLIHLLILNFVHGVLIRRNIVYIIMSIIFSKFNFYIL